MPIKGNSYNCDSCKRDVEINTNWDAPVQEQGGTYCQECYCTKPEFAEKK